MKYRDFLELYKESVETLVRVGISREVVDYKHIRKPKKPTAAFSEFLIQRQLGDWSESAFKNGINRKAKKFKVLRYGAAGRIVVGQPEFDEFFDKYWREVQEIGKRPDLLVFEEKTINELNLPEDISGLKNEELNKLARMALAGIEVRSSRYYATRYRRVKRKDVSFTLKLEDIPLIVRWIATYKIPCFYVQVFFDEIYVISFEEMLKIIKESGKKYIRRMEKNQRKITFYFPVSKGVLIGSVTEFPELKPEVMELRDGRVIFYLTFQGGEMDIDVNRFFGYLGLK